VRSARSGARVRRSHAQRTSETRARLIAAVVESVAAVGFARTTAPEIARRAGVTWGAVQHHFGGKHGMLLAVLEDSFRRFAERLEGIPLEGTSLEKRVALFIDAAALHFTSPHYRSAVEILLNHPRRSRAAAQPDWGDRMFRAWDRVWRRLFADAPIPRRRHFVLEHYAISVLSGMASTLVLEGGVMELRPSELELLKETLVRELTGDGSS
jgi:AcrR family transcriptional regulator